MSERDQGFLDGFENASKVVAAARFSSALTFEKAGLMGLRLGL